MICEASNFNTIPLRLSIRRYVYRLVRNMKLLLLVCAGGAIGAGLRYALNMLALHTLSLQLHWATFTINILGSLIMGAVTAYILLKLPDAIGLRVFVATGILGGFTTFSAFSLDTLLLLERGNISLALAYIIGSVTLSILACILGYFGVRALIL